MATTLPPRYQQALTVAPALWRNHGERPLDLAASGPVTLPDGTKATLTADQLHTHAHSVLAAHRPRMRGGKPDYVAHCTGCPSGTDYRRCRYAGWARAWNLVEYTAECDRDDPPGWTEPQTCGWEPDAGLQLLLAIDHRRGRADLRIESSGEVHSPYGKGHTEPEAVRAELARISRVHRPIGPALAAQPTTPARASNRLCRDCVRHARPFARYDRCIFQTWAAGWRAAPRWLWNCIGNDSSTWPTEAQIHYDLGTLPPEDPQRVVLRGLLRRLGS